MRREPKQVKVTIEEMSVQVLACRADGHVMPPQQFHDEVTTKRGWLIEVKRHRECTRCGYVSVVVMDGSLEPVKSSSKYPGGYLSAQGRIRKSAARRQQFRKNGYKVRA